MLLLAPALAQLLPPSTMAPARTSPPKVAAVRRGDRASEAAVSTRADQRTDPAIRQSARSRSAARPRTICARSGPRRSTCSHAASSDTDPEVAASARYLLRQITVRWVRSDDPPAVRRLLIDYGDLSDDIAIDPRAANGAAFRRRRNCRPVSHRSLRSIAARLAAGGTGRHPARRRRCPTVPRSIPMWSTANWGPACASRPSGSVNTSANWMIRSQPSRRGNL